MIFTLFWKQPTTRLSLVFAGLAAVLALTAALAAQYGFLLHPCELCMLQRFPYAAIIALAIIGEGLPERARFYSLLLCGLLFFSDAGIALYHTGVEYGWFPGPTACTNKETGIQSLEEMRRQIMNAPLVSCDQAAGYVFGLSLAAWNMVYAFLLAIITLILARKIYAKS